MNIVIRSPNWIGDCLMSIQAIRALKDSLPDSRIYIVTKNHLQEIYKNIKEIEETIPIPDRLTVKNIFQVSKNLKKIPVDVGILFTNSFQSAFLFKCSGIKKLIGYKKDLRGILLHRGIKFPKNGTHHIYFYMNLIENFLGKKINTDYSSQLVISNGEMKKISSITLKLGINRSKCLLGISPAAAYGSAKEWPPENFRELINRIKQNRPDFEVLLFGSKRERKKIADIIKDVNGSVHNLAGELNLREVIGFISLCNGFISNDSGLMHIASSLNIPLIGIFGPTLPHKTGPLNKKSKIIYHPVDCAPCKYRDCPIDHPCMKSIGVDEVYNEIVGLLNKDKAMDG